MHARSLGAVTSLAVLAVVAQARADAASDAKDLFDRGRELRASGDCAGALPLFHKAFEIYPSALGSLRNAAECEESTGRWASARRSWLDLKRALMMTHDAKYEGWEADTDAAAQRLAARVSHLTVDVSTGGHNTGGLEVTITGEPLPVTLVGTRLDRDPGKYVVRARLGSGEPAEQSTDLVTGESRAVHLVVAPAGQPLPPQPKPRETSGGVSPWTIGGAVTVSLGVVALAGMGVAIAVRQDALSTLTFQCPNYATEACPSSVKPTVDRGTTASTTATVLAIAGGVATAAGVVMLIASATSHRERAVAVRVSPFGASLEGTF